LGACQTGQNTSPSSIYFDQLIIMLLFKKVKDLSAFIRRQKSKKARIGFVPTMGALHEGHLSLLRTAGTESDITICSVFVNPTQFNEQKDLDAYPRTPHKDIHLLHKVGCDVLFMPEADEIYPPGLDTQLELDLHPLDTVMEGAFRPGHFEGVAQVVKRLLDIVQPDRLYMGQKDFQQLTIIQHMIRQLELPTELVSCPIKREENGLAMSSRNVRLSKELQDRASVIYQTLMKAKSWIREMKPSEVEKKALESLSIPGFRPEYFKIVDPLTLMEVSNVENLQSPIACTAVWAGEVRLIDNMFL
jgi:pantoate--beta-alanine ligase